MASLPEHWESDYDGSRWFFRYKPTGIIQYTFPKPGDEFPEYIDAAAPPLDLPPEEKLVSQQQVKRKGTSDSSSAKSPAAKQGDEVTSATLAKGEGGGFWFQPDFMYLGPGSYNDISPVDEQDEEQAGLGFGGRQGKGPETDADQAGRPHISPETSAGTTPLNSQTAAATPVLNSVVEVSETAEVPVELPTRRAPVGVVAELPSETTARCRDETNPAPVELPDHRTAERGSGSVSYNSAFAIDPVELPTVHQRATLPDVSEKRNAPPASSNSWHSQQNPTAQAVLQAHRPPSVAAEPAGEKYQPYNPVRYVPPPNDSRRASQPVLPPSNAGSRYGEPISSNVPYTVPAQGPSDAPSFLRPPQPPPKRPLDDAPDGNQPPPSSQGNTAATRVPSVLQPARGRPNLPLQTSVASIASSSKQYEPYSPYRELQDDIDETVKLLASGMGEETGAASNRASPLQDAAAQKKKPGPVENRGSFIARTNTLPLHMPSLPFMGGGPSSSQMTSNPRPSPPAPVASTNTRSQASEAAPRTETDLSDYMKYATTAPANSADLPQPLNLARNSVVYPAYSPPSQPINTQRRESEDNQHAAARHSFASDLVTRPSSTFSVVSDFSTISEQTPPPEAHPQRPPFTSSHASAPSVYRGTAYGGPSVGIHRNPSTQSQVSVASTSSRQSHVRPSSRLSSHSGEAPDVPPKDQSFGRPAPPQNRPHSIAYGQTPDHDLGQRPVTFAGQPMYFNPEHSGAPSTEHHANPGYQAGQVPPQGQGQRVTSMAGPPSSESWPNQTSPPMQRPGSSQQPVMSFQSWMGPQSGASVPHAQQMMPQGTALQTQRPIQPFQLQPGPRPQSTPAHQQFPSVPVYNQAVPSGLQVQPAGVRGSSPSGKERNRLVKQPKNGGGSPPRGNHPAPQISGGGRAKLQKSGGSVGSIPHQTPAFSTMQQQHQQQQHSVASSQQSSQVPLHFNQPPQPRVSSVPPPNLPQQSHSTRPVSYMAPYTTPQPNLAQRQIQASIAQRPLSQQLPQHASFSQRTEQLQTPPPRPLSSHDAQRPVSRQQEPARTSEQQWGQQPQPRAPQDNPSTHAHSLSFGGRPPPTQQPPVQQIPQDRPPQGYNVQPPAQSHTSPRREPPSQSGQQQISTTKTQPPSLQGEGAQPGWGGQGQHAQPRYGQTPPAPLATSKHLALPKKAEASPVELPSSPIPVELSSDQASSSSQQQQRSQVPAERSGREPHLEQPRQQEAPQREPPRQEPPRQEIPPQEPPRQEQPRREPPPRELPRQEPLRQEPPRQEPLRQVPPRQEAPRQEPPRQEPLLQQTPRQDPLRQEPPRQEPPQQEPPFRQPLRQEPPRQEPPRQEPPRQQPLRQQPPRQTTAAPGPDQRAFADRNMASDNQPSGRRSSGDPTQRQNQAPVNRPPPPEAQKQAPQPAPRPPAQLSPQPSQQKPASRLPARQVPVQTPTQQPANPASGFSGSKPPNQPAQNTKIFPVDKKETAVAGKPEPPVPANAPTPVADPTPPAPSKAAEKAPGGWGDTSGYDGSGWGDDDDFY